MPTNCTIDLPPEEQVFSNQVIISQIYSYLSLKDCKSCLRINRAWYGTCINRFRQKTVVYFKTPMDVQRYTKYFSKFPSENPVHTEFIFDISMNLSSVGRDPEENESRKMRRLRRKRNSQLEAVTQDNFFKAFAPQIKLLEATIVWGSKKQMDKLLSVIRCLENCEDLRLRCQKMNGRYTQIPERGNLVLPNVRKYVHIFTSDIPWNVASEFTLGVFPSLEYLELQPWGDGPVHHNQCRYSNNVLTSMTDTNIDNPRVLSNLKGFALILPEPPYLVKLAALPTSLERLELIDGLSNWTEAMSTVLNQVLERHAHSLKYLKFPINITKRHWNLQKDKFGNFIVPLHFPQLPELEELHLDFRLERISAELEGKLTFPQTEINYENMFPKLKTLKICAPIDKGSESSWVDSINDVFIPLDSTNAKKYGEATSLRNLQIVSPTGVGESEAFLKRISSTFPNVRRPILHYRNTSIESNGK